MPTTTGLRQAIRRHATWRDDPDVKLMERVRSDDQAAFAELRVRYASRIFGFFCRQIHDRAEAEDLTQEVFLRLFRARRRYLPRARFATWIFHIAQNVARNALRSRRRRPCVHLDLREPATQSLFEGAMPDRAGAPERPVERAEVAARVRAAVAGLTGRTRTALELHQFADRSYAQVAQDMDMTPKAAKSLLYRARNQLRQTLSPFAT